MPNHPETSDFALCIAVNGHETRQSSRFMPASRRAVAANPAEEVPVDMSAIRPGWPPCPWHAASVMGTKLARTNPCLLPLLQSNTPPQAKQPRPPLQAITPVKARGKHCRQAGCTALAISRLPCAVRRAIAEHHVPARCNALFVVLPARPALRQARQVHPGQVARGHCCLPGPAPAAPDKLTARPVCQRLVHQVQVNKKRQPQLPKNTTRTWKGFNCARRNSSGWPG